MSDTKETTRTESHSLSSSVSNLFKVYTYSFFDTSGGFKPKHWAKDLEMVIEKDGVKMKLEGKEIQQLVSSLPRTFGGSY